jgi:hypothetical protein
MKRPNVLWITALVLGWSFDFLFWQHMPPGISFAIYVLLCLAGGFLVLLWEGIKPAWKSLLLLLPIAFFSAMTFIRQESLSQFLSFAFTLGLLGLLAVSYLGGRWPWYGLFDYLANFFKLAGSMLSRGLALLIESRKPAAAGDQAEAAAAGRRSGWKPFWAVLRGVLIAVPVVAIFAALLSSADLVFAKRLNEFIALFRLEHLPEYIFRAVYILIGAYLLVGVILHAAQKSRDEKLVGEEKPLVPAFLGFTEAAVVLGAVEALFLAFVVIQFQYFFGGAANIHQFNYPNTAGFTYADYARRGFGELVAVAFCSLLLFLGLSGIVKRETPSQRRAFSGLGIGMVVLIAVILASAFQRLLLYEAAYGFTRLRTYTHVFMLWLGVLLAAVVVLEILRRERLFVTAGLLAAIGFAVTLNLLNVDAFIVRQNVGRAPEGKGLDVAYLASLSSDSVPELAAEFRAPSLPGMTRDAVGAVLVCRLHNGSMRPTEGWRSYTLTGWQADLAMQAVQAKLDKYRVDDSGWPVKVYTPGSVMYECWGSGGMD